MRKVTIDFTKNPVEISSLILGKQGEHNATELIITPPSEMSENEEIVSYCVAFQIGAGKKTYSPIIDKAETITVPIEREVTRVNYLSIQLEAYDNKENLLVKSERIDNLIFDASVTGDEFEGTVSSGMGEQVAANTEFRKTFPENAAEKLHSHENAEVINKFSEDDEGNPLYDGNSIGGVADKQIASAVKTYLNDNPVSGITDEQAADLASNTKSRHSHDNKETLDKLNLAQSRLWVDGTEVAYSHEIPEALSTKYVIDKLGGIDTLVNYGTQNYFTGYGFKLLVEHIVSKYATKELVEALGSPLKLELVEALPETGAESTIYLVPSGDNEANIYKEYLFVNGLPELIGSTQIDLTGYAKTEDIPTKTSELENDSGFVTEPNLNEAVESALVEAKASGEFDGSDYVLTEADKAEIVEDVKSVCVAKNQGSANVGKMLVVGADGNLTLSDIPENVSGDIIGVLDEDNNIIITGELTNGTYVFKYENADGTYADIGSLVVGGVVQYSITATLTECTAVSGNATIINEGETATLKYVAKDGFKLTDAVTVSGASYTWDSATGTLVLSNPTADVTISITATKSGVTNIIDTVGYTDGKRLSTSTGNLSDADGYTTTGMITIPSTLPRPVTVRTDGIDFNKSTSCAIVLYDGGETKTASSQLYNKTSTAFNGFTWSFDSDGNMTMTYDATNAAYFKICGYGSGENLIVTINEEITK